jgi:hypothetical protein
MIPRWAEADMSFPLEKLHGKKMNGHVLHLREVKQLKLSGWKGFKLYLRNSRGNLSVQPAIEGIYSAGGKDGVRPWMDLDYHGDLGFRQKERAKDTLSLSEKGLDRPLFGCLGDVIPPGGHLMLSYEGEDKIHLDTLKSLSLGIPPAATPLGFLIFQAGFQLVKDWYLAEGGHEGPRKLWGEKAPDDRRAEPFYQKTVRQLHSYLENRKGRAPRNLEKLATERSKEILTIIQGHRSPRLGSG